MLHSKKEYPKDAETEAARPQAADLAQRLMGRLRLRHWALLAALAEVPVLQKAAQALHMTQPAATKMLADLEEVLGFALFERHPRGLRVTELGRPVLAHALQMQSGLQRLAESLTIWQQGGAGQVAMGAITGAAPDVLARAVNALKQARPLLNIRIVGETSDQILALLERGEIEFAVGRFSDRGQHERFAIELLAQEPLQLVVRAGHPLARRRRIGLAELMDWPWVLQAEASPARQLMDRELRLAGLDTPRNLVECASSFAALHLLQSGDAIGLLAEAVARDHVQAGLVRPLPVEGLALREGFGLLTRKGDVLSEPAQALRQALREAAGGLPTHTPKACAGVKPIRCS